MAILFFINMWCIPHMNQGGNIGLMGVKYCM